MLIYIYDAEGTPIGMQYRKTTYAANEFDTYWFEKNLQGDIVAVYSEDGTKLISYTYDAWGNFTTTYSNGGAATTATYNPFTYRGYYYDAELEFYYLNSRYYDSNTGRFINVDGIGLLGASSDFFGLNLYVYCGNNPIMRIDISGFTWREFVEEFKNYDGTYSLYDNKRFQRNAKFHEQLFVFNPIAPSNELTTMTFSVGGSFTVITGGWENENADLSLLDFGKASAEAWFSPYDIGFKAGVAIWNPTYSFKVGSVTLDFGVVIGNKWAFKKGINEFGFSVGIFEFAIYHD